jgi:hypothetical protein
LDLHPKNFPEVVAAALDSFDSFSSDPDNLQIDDESPPTSLPSPPSSSLSLNPENLTNDALRAILP